MARYGAKRLLLAFVRDQNPTHIEKAAALLERHGLGASEVMRKNVTHAKAVRKTGRAKGKRFAVPGNTLRHIDLVGALLTLEGSAQIPRRITPGVPEALAKRFDLTEIHVKQIISVWREVFGTKRTGAPRIPFRIRRP